MKLAHALKFMEENEASQAPAAPWVTLWHTESSQTYQEPTYHLYFGPFLIQYYKESLLDNESIAQIFEI